MNRSLTNAGWVVGLGCDIIEVDRVQRAVERHGDRFLRRVFTAGEREYCASRSNPFPHYAARFAAKEAVSKAFSTGIGADLDWTSVEVCKGPREEPLIHLDAKGQALLARLGADRVLVSLAHTKAWAEAVALLLRGRPETGPGLKGGQAQ